MNKVLIALLVLSFSISCTSSLNKNDKQFLKDNEIKKEHFANLYFANEDICKVKGLPVTQFVIEYPNSFNANFPNDGKTHIELEKLQNGNVVEYMNIGNTTINQTNKQLTEGILEMLITNLKQVLPNLKILKSGQYEFNGEMTYLFEAIADFSGMGHDKIDGVYKILSFIPMPKNKKDLNAVMVTFMASQESNIQNFSDFERNSLLSDIWSSFRYIE